MWLDNLRNIKKKSGYTTKEIAEQSGIPEPTLEKIFSGATKEPKLPTIQRLVHCLGCTLDDLEDSPTVSSTFSEPVLARDEHALLDNYRKLSQRGKEYIQEQMSMALLAYAGKNIAASNLEAAE